MASIDKEISKVEQIPVNSLLQYLKTLGYIANIQYILSNSSSGEYNKKTKDVIVEGPNKSMMSRTGAHEAIHAISNSDLPSRTQKLIDAMNDRGIFDKLFTPELIGARGWDTVNPKADNMNVTGKTPQTERRKQIYSDFVGSIPDKTSWSGVTNKDTTFTTGGPRFEEAMAYYFTHPEVKGDYGDRTKQFALYLRDRGVPWSNIDGLLDAMRSGVANDNKQAESIRQTQSPSPNIKND